VEMATEATDAAVAQADTKIDSGEVNAPTN
jgi:hypothetical protein